MRCKKSSLVFSASSKDLKLPRYIFLPFCQTLTTNELYRVSKIIYFPYTQGTSSTKIREALKTMRPGNLKDLK